jgi:Mg2+-importing ATPase
VIVGLTPEMLPLIIAMNLSKQAKTLIKKKIIVKNLGSIQNFGAIDVFCTDKTGTITMNKIILEKHIDVFGKNSDNVLFYAYLNSYFQTGYKNLIDEAIISKVAKNMSDDIGTYSYYKEIPYDFNRRRMSVIINRNNKERMMITKGSVKEMLSICTNVLIKGNEEKITKEMLNEIENQTKELNAQGMRTIAVAICNEQNKLSGNLSIATENELTLIGFLGLLDPPKDSATNAIKALKDSGVDVKIITGDDAEVAKSICKTVGINNIESIDGNEIANMSDEELTNKVLSIGIFAKVSPEQKKQIIKCIRKNNRVVGYMGDGINDVAAMKEADISISVNTATDIAKETSDIILLEGDLNVLENGVLEGRKTYVNIMKYIKITIFSMFGNIISLLVASI